MITNPAPITIPAVPATSADGLWIRALTINAPSTTGKISVSAQVMPYASATGQLFPGKAKVMNIPDLSAAIAADASGVLGNAYTALIAAIEAQVVAQNLYPSSGH